MTDHFEYDEFDYCYECTGYGDDYFLNDDGELELYCPYCIHGGLADDD